ncbi:vanillate/4-hydroxybenzoate decarboxylase subunit D [Staphylococcus pasteuri]|uniref:Vanillic acid non-oxidative decarboxylation protein n=2 Tax=Staphylococcus TaxID=1279 RepID=A0ABY1H5F7_9STAP|nr:MULTISPECIES: non-oxidative hydroxyarylic acid decarboxylases subunit D [Staphylococcus]ATH63585.1 vanillic acid non-oxidative decarboxylation protein [Staphylococcus pasteuri]KKI55810.1 Hydroxyaromatic non-oxidative decarboxylase protein D [Staphylococcus pasteuri]MCF7599572.1 vanillic acid non-oxidative decarboxylation protein [Staphylococcus pasteuri]MDI3232025.1 non-oxidative hydroxyarylic acid decarboxylases subunit D [Staphylococcus pasteuri]MDO6573701.1 non-oxidative hydroxyarylic ac
MMCPRCDSKDVELLTKAPKDDAWEVHICNTCTFSWRSTEGEHITDPEKYDKRFKLNPEEFESLDQIPPIPELKSK